MRKKVTSYTFALALTFVVLINLVGLAFAQGNCANIIVNPANLGTSGWAIQVTGDATVTLVDPAPAGVPAGTGAARLFTGSDGTQAAQLRNTTYAGVSLSDISALEYCTYAKQWNGAQVPYIVLNVDVDGDNDFDALDDLLIFEPEYSNGNYNTDIPAQPAVALNTWQCWDALAGGWYSQNGANGSGPGIDVQSFSELVEFFGPDAQIVNNDLGQGGVRVVSGFGSPIDVFEAFVDKVKIDVGHNCTVYDFEGVNNPTHPDQCKNGGWMSFGPPAGPFRNQGQCISFFK